MSEEMLFLQSLNYLFNIKPHLKPKIKTNENT